MRNRTGTLAAGLLVALIAASLLLGASEGAEAEDLAKQFEAAFQGELYYYSTCLFVGAGVRLLLVYATVNALLIDIDFSIYCGFMGNTSCGG